ncbi:hypothetical protein ACS5PK_19120 [Roseateles sp. DB2]|uniref:hypothetical protein n=1 Tax=Roseateles sp. DB2 TaxID=3453717 RepID=UPI003EE9EA2B
MTAHRPFTFRLALTLAAALVLPLCAQSAPSASIYVTQAGWGHLSLQGDRFELLATGSNGHSCVLDGARQGSVGDAGEGCKLQFKPLPGGRLEVLPASPSMDQACRMFCGARASFDGVYHPMPQGCEDEQRHARQAQGLQAYKAGRHAEAASRWAELERSCGVFMHWTESYALNNDRAVAAYHLGDFAACVALSRPVADDQQLQVFRETAPTDHDNLLPLLRAARFNLQRCSEKAAGKR